ncbi:MAG: GNAT family N-acetyltransferase [Actinomycetota bacterium]|nr:GNAT family N-acetyltransferase [Actinomycetota bacterium]MEC9474005.1 GNAT family N-acetyltransferase [Actinomycetota bacterium]MED5362020.1 GNAT family N-acetyltransferase [Actinomycetota bacterium]
MSDIQAASFYELSVERLYDILRLRVEVFVVEQECAYSEIDNLDAQATHFWIDDATGIATYLRLIREENCCRIGRVVTRADVRSKGLSKELIEHVMRISEGPWVLSAQSYLRDWYINLGFSQTGPEFLEDGIPHIPMSRNID